MDEILNRLRAELKDRYEIEREVGRGGMAVVFLVKDLRHDRRVALKVMRPDIGISAASERFLREIRTAAQLHHPHILPLYDSGAAGDLLFYVMPYVEGETVRDRLTRAGPFAVDETVRIAREVADALAFAHDRGIVHRDIKPENIFLSAGHAAVADFGIARAADAAGFKTETGVALGTPFYMSPEQAMADPKVDGRTDQYALACVVYEMLAGHPPFQGATLQAVMARHTMDAVPALTTIRDVPPELETAVFKAMSKTPADRFPTASAFADSLQLAVPSDSGARRAQTERARERRMPLGLAGALALVVLVAGWFGVQKLRAGAAISDPGLRLVAILPFTSSGDSAQANLANGIVEGVSAGLVQARAANLGILSGARVRDYGSRANDPRQVGRELGVNAVVTGNVTVLGQRIRVTPQVTDVATGRTIWQRPFDGALVVNGRVQDVWNIIDTITAQIVAALQPELSVATPARGARTRDPEALALYLQGVAVTDRLSRANLDKAIDLFERALARDSTFADAWVALADALSWKMAYGSAPPAEVSIAWRKAVDRAIALDSLNPDAFNLRGFLRSAYEWDWRGNLDDARRAVRLAPGRATLNADFSAALAFAGFNDSSLIYARRAVALDPRSSYVWSQLGNRFAFAGIRDSALYAGQRAVQLDSNALYAYWLLMNGYLDAGRRASADSAASRMLRLAADNAGGMALVATYYARSKNVLAARSVVDQITALARKEYVAASTLGGAHLAVGDRARALDGLETSVRVHDLSIHNDLALLYGPLRGDPRYEAVKRKIFPGVPGPNQPFP